VRNVIAITKREFASYFNSPIGYVVLILFLGISSWLFFSGFFADKKASLDGFFGQLPLLFLFFVPALSMRLWSEEKKLGTLEFLLTLPVRPTEAALGKFFGGLGIILLALILSLSLPITVSMLGTLDWGPVVGGYVAALLLGSAYLALGLFVSGLTENQVIAYLLGALAGLFFVLLGTEVVVDFVPNWLAPWVLNLSLSSHFQSISRGVIDSKDLLYYAAFAAFFLTLNVKAVELKRWG
jgi:ABC-type transport system involved in multi-copper enzyme maturation permease subunit